MRRAGLRGRLVQCSKFNVSGLVWPLQTYWLLLAVSQDQPKNKYVAELRDCCERAALEGSWVRTSAAALGCPSFHRQGCRKRVPCWDSMKGHMDHVLCSVGIE